MRHCAPKHEYARHKHADKNTEKGSVLKIVHFVLSFPWLAKTGGQVSPDAGLQSGRDPSPTHGCLQAQSFGDLQLARITFALGPQLLAGPSQLAQFLPHDALGPLLLGLPPFFPADTFIIARCHRVEQFLTKLLAAQRPPTTDFLPHLLIVFPTTQLHARAQFLSARRAVLGNAGLPQHAIDAQPTGACGARLQVSRIAAPGIIAELMAALEQSGARRIEMDVVTDRAQITRAAAIDDQGFVATTEEVTEVLVTTIETGRIGAKEPLHACDQIGARGFP